MRTTGGRPAARPLAGAGCRLRFPPASSPALSLIAAAFAQLTALRRRAKARTTEALEAALGELLAAITPRQARRYFAACGYGTATYPCKTL